MSVTFTPNIGLAEPTEAELAANWTRFTALAPANNNLILANANIPLTSYTPTIIATTTPPSVGTGGTNQVRGQYRDIQKFVFFEIEVEFFDPGVAGGSGEYGFSLPFVVDGSYHSVGTSLVPTAGNIVGALSVLGEAYLYDNSSVGGSGSGVVDTVTIAGTSYCRVIPETFTGKTSLVLRDSQPFLVATNDKFMISGSYRRI